MTLEQGTAVISALTALQTQLSAFSTLFSGGFFWFALFCVGVVLILVSAMLGLFIDFFVRLLWGKR